MIRLATDNDLEEILSIFNDAIINTTSIYAYTPQTIEDRKVWYKEKVDNNYPVLVYEESKKVIGFATFDSFRQHPAYKYTIENSIYVHKDYRQEGIGKKLLEEIITLANERKYATMVAGIDAENYGSIILHEKLGFKFVGIIKKAGYKFEKWLDLAFYQLELIGPDEPIEEEKIIVK